MKSSDANQNNESTSNCNKIIIDSDVPIEELLGSVTAYNNVEGTEARSQQLRASARVFKKMKLDSAASNAAATVPEKKEPAKEEAPAKPEARKFRPIWTADEKDLFFDALNEYGKDFEAIHLYISNKLKKKGLPESMIKTKDQIRHLYYRTFQKISKHAKFSEEIKKVVQELYANINYGELRKKVSVSEKNLMKINELMYRGSVNIRAKGKTIRIRTPMCKALRKLNQLDDKQDDVKLPSKVTVELLPKDMETFLKVQELAQNPRVKTAIPLQKRLSTLIKFMSEKWRTKSAEEYNKAVNSTSAVTSDCVSEKKVAEDMAILVPPLRLAPPRNTKISMPSFNLAEYLTSQSICLNAYEERIGVKIPGEQLFPISNSSTSKAHSKKGTKRPRHESNSEKQLLAAKQVTTTTTVTASSSVETNEYVTDVDDVVDVVVNEILALQNALKDYDIMGNDKTTENRELKLEEEANQERIETIRKGWTLEDCGNVSVGDLYLMFGSDSKLTLEYSWDPVDDKLMKKEECANEVSKSNGVDITNITEEENDIKASLSSDSSPPLSILLTRLLSIAKLHYRKNIVKCPCGHVCGSSGNILTKPKTSATKAIKEEPQDSNKNVNINLPENQATSVPIILQTQVSNISPTVFFRRPNTPNAGLQAQLASISRLKPKYCNRRGRFRRLQPIVVERKLPVLANKADKDNGGRQIVQMNIISQNGFTQQSLRSIAPKIIEVNTDNSKPGEVNQTLVNTEYVNGTISMIAMDEVGSNNYQVLEKRHETVAVSSVSDAVHITDNATTPSRVGSPTSLSNLLDMALHPHENNDIILGNVGCDNTKEEGNISFAGLLSEAVTSTPPTSPSRILKENENQWLNSEVGDFSLSSFLGHLESPMKNISSGPSTNADDTRLGLTQDVDQHLQSLLIENSMDYTAKFADLAAQVADKK